MLTDTQREARIGRIGSSDIAAILGVSPFSSGYSVWRRLVFGVEGAATTPRMRRGSTLEESVVKIAAMELGLEIVDYPAPPVIGDGDRLPAWFVDNTDAVFNDGSLAEIKAYSFADDGLPEHVRLQCLWHMAARPQAPRCHAVIFVNVGDVRYHVVERNEEEIARLVERVGEWYARYVVPEVAPPMPEDLAVGVAAYKAAAHGGDGDVLDAADYQTADGVPVEQVCAEYADLTAQIERLQTEADARRAAIADLLAREGAVRLVSRSGKFGVVSTRRTDWKAVAETFNPSPALLDRHSKTSESLRYWGGRK